VAQCGGAGNLASVITVLAGIGDGWTGPRTYPTPDETRARLETAGFAGPTCWLNEESPEFESRDAVAAFLRTVVLWPHLERLPPSEHDAFVDLVVGGLPGLTLDYVRLNIVARRGS
jgi:trans-aconitate 2-methyltransferase